MTTGRLEAFSDGVIAILITIMVLELKVPHDASFTALRPILPIFLSYVLSFIYIGIYWNNHHHLMAAAKTVTGPILWANLHLLFWLSLIPFATAWAGVNSFASHPVALYGVVLICAGTAYYILARALVSNDGKRSRLFHAIGKDNKGKFSVLIYAAAVGLSFFNPRTAYALYFVVAMMWLVPDKRIENVMK